MLFLSLNEDKFSVWVFKIFSLKHWKSYYWKSYRALFWQLLENSDQLALNWSIAFELFLLHNWLMPSIENTAADYHGKYSHQIAPGSSDILTFALLHCVHV